MAQQREDEGPAADISRQRRQGERPDKVAPGQASVKHQIKDLDRSHHDMSRIRQGDKPGHENNHHDLGRTGDRKHPDHGGDQPSGNNRISEHLRRAVFHYIFGDADKGLTSWFIKDGHKIEGPCGHCGTDEVASQHHRPQPHQQTDVTWGGIVHHRQNGGNRIFREQLLAGHDHDNKAEGIPEIFQ